MVEPLLCGIVLGLVPITILGLFVSAYNQYRRQGGTFGGLGLGSSARGPSE